MCVNRIKERKAQMEYLARHWHGLVRLDIRRFRKFQEFLMEEGWQIQSPDEGECLRICRDGRVLKVTYDGRTTSCRSYMHMLWIKFQVFVLEEPIK